MILICWIYLFILFSCGFPTEFITHALVLFSQVMLNMEVDDIMTAQEEKFLGIC